MKEGYYYSKLTDGELARAYIPFQMMNQVFSPNEALRKGTLFPELYRPYRLKENRGYGGKYNG